MIFGTIIWGPRRSSQELKSYTLPQKWAPQIFGTLNGKQKTTFRNFRKTFRSLRKVFPLSNGKVVPPGTHFPGPGKREIFRAPGSLGKVFPGSGKWEIFWLSS